jgi:hypothetical protein
MKNLKLGMLACGALCLVIFLTGDFGDLISRDPANAMLFVVLFAAPISMGVLGLLRPPLLQWSAIVATSGFGTAIVKLHLWDDLSHLGRLRLVDAAFSISIVIGFLVSILAIAVPEEKR